MADASKQLDPTARDLTGAGETLALDRAVSRKRGGTGKSVTTVAELLTELGAEQVANKGVANGYATLDSGLLVPLAQLRDMTAATAGAAGARGQVPAPAAGDQRRALTGGKTFADQLELSSVVEADGTKLFDFAGLSDREWRLVATAAAAAGQQARLSVRSLTGLAHGDLALEPLGLGRVTRNGDPLQQTLKRSRYILADAFSPTFTTVGMPAPTLATPGAAAAALDDVNGCYVSLTNLAVTGSIAGLSTGTLTKRQLTPDLIVSFRTALLNSRCWIGMFDSDPAALTTLSATGVIGAGLWWDQVVHGNGSKFWRAITSSGSAQTESVSAIDATGNGYTVLRIRSLGGALFEFSNFNTTTFAWEHITTNSVNVPGPVAPLKLFVSLYNLDGSGTRTMSVRVIDLFQN